MLLIANLKDTTVTTPLVTLGIKKEPIDRHRSAIMVVYWLNFDSIVNYG